MTPRSPDAAANRAMENHSSSQHPSTLGGASRHPEYRNLAKNVYTSRFVRVILAQGAYKSLVSRHFLTFPKHILKIKDDSCLSVLYTSFLEICYFDGHQSSLNWATIQGLELDAPTPVFPTSTDTTPFSNWQQVSEDIIRKKVLKILGYLRDWRKSSKKKFAIVLSLEVNKKM